MAMPVLSALNAIKKLHEASKKKKEKTSKSKEKLKAKTPQRTVSAGAVKIVSATDASVVQFGDGATTRLKTAAIAVQRAIPNFRGDEIRFAEYPLYFLPAPRPEGPPGGMLIRTRPDALIRIGFLEAMVVRSNSVVRVGNTGKLAADARTLHIRHFNNVIPGDAPSPLPTPSARRDIR